MATDPNDPEELAKSYYQQAGFDPNASDLASSVANIQKYGTDGPNGGEQANIMARASNTPNQDEHAPAAATPTQAWTANPQTAGLSSDLYTELQSRIAGANTPVDPNDPIIKAQSDAYNAQQTRASRSYLSNIAEKAGPLANIAGEQRMASEKLGQNQSDFLAQLMSTEQGARRDAASQALGLEGSQLTSDQNRDLQGQLGFGQLALNDKLGSGQLALGNRTLDTNSDEFLRQLAQRQWEDQDSSDLNWAQL